MSSHDPMHWKLALVKPDGKVLTDNARNRNARFGKMDVVHSQRGNHVGELKLNGCGVTYDQKPLSRAAQAILTLNAVARDTVRVTEARQEIVTPLLNKRMARLAARMVR